MSSMRVLEQKFPVPEARTGGKDFFTRIGWSGDLRDSLAKARFERVSAIVRTQPEDLRNLVLLMGSSQQIILVHARTALDIEVVNRTGEPLRLLLGALSEGLQDKKIGAACAQLMARALKGPERENILEVFLEALRTAPDKTRIEIVDLIGRDAAGKGLAGNVRATLLAISGCREERLEAKIQFVLNMNEDADRARNEAP